MKKLLITSSALVLVAGAAVADVKVGGDGRMGVVLGHDYVLGSTGTTTKSTADFSSRIRISFTASGETDGGLQFGGSIRADNASAGAKGAAGNVWISGEWGKISMGDVVGAAEAAIGDLPEIGYTDLASAAGYDNDIWYLTGDGAMTGTDNPVLLYEYSTGDLSFYLSMSDGEHGPSSSFDPSIPGVVADPKAQEYALGVNYSFGDYWIAAGYEVRDSGISGVKNETHGIISGGASFGDTSVQVYWGQWDTGVSGPNKTLDHFGVGVTSQFDALTVMAYVHSYEKERYNGKDLTAWGIGAAYDLGGGASIVGGIVGDNDKFSMDGGTTWVSSKPRADLGVKFKF